MLSMASVDELITVNKVLLKELLSQITSSVQCGNWAKRVNEMTAGTFESGSIVVTGGCGA